MFAVEIEFNDGISPPELLLVKKPIALIGSSDKAHVLIESTSNLPYEIKLVREIGRSFSCYQLAKPGHSPQNTSSTIKNNFTGSGEFKLGEISLKVVALDYDLLLKGEEMPDDGAIRILNRALTIKTGALPGILVNTVPQFFLSMIDDAPLNLGTERGCFVRLTKEEINNAQIEFTLHNGKLYVKERGSGKISINGEEILDHQILASNDVIEIKDGLTIIPILDDSDLSKLSKIIPTQELQITEEISQYPCLITNCPHAQPNRYNLAKQGKIQIGRDPTSTIWFKLDYISRKHFELEWSSLDEIFITDLSSNGTYIGKEKLQHRAKVALSKKLTVINFNSEDSIALCFSQGEEDLFLGEHNQIDNETNPTELSPSFPSDDSTQEIKEQNNLLSSKGKQTNEDIRKGTGKIISLSSPIITDNSQLSPRRQRRGSQNLLKTFSTAKNSSFEETTTDLPLLHDSIIPADADIRSRLLLDGDEYIEEREEEDNLVAIDHSDIFPKAILWVGIVILILTIGILAIGILY